MYPKQESGLNLGGDRVSVGANGKSFGEFELANPQD